MIQLTPDAILLLAIMIGMTALTVVFLARPWFRRSTEASVDRTKFTIQVYRDQLAELETDMNEQRLTEQQYTEARRELERSMMDDVGPSAPSMPLPPPEKSHNAGLWALILVAVALPILALILYGVLHISIGALTPNEDLDGTNSAQTNSQQAAPSAGAPGGNFNIEEMVGRLATRLQNNPDDAKGWAMLGRSYTVLKRFPESAEAYGRSYQLRSAASLTANDADMVANYAEALSRANDNSLQGRVQELIEQALKLNAQNTKALWLGGMIAFRAEDYKLATRRWEQLYELTPRSSELSQMLQGAIEEAKIRSGEMVIVPEESDAPPQDPAEAQQPAGNPSAAATEGSDNAAPSMAAPATN